MALNALAVAALPRSLPLSRSLHCSPLKLSGFAVSSHRPPSQPLFSFRAPRGRRRGAAAAAGHVKVPPAFELSPP